MAPQRTGNRPNENIWMLFPVVYSCETMAKDASILHHMEYIFLRQTHLNKPCSLFVYQDTFSDVMADLWLTFNLGLELLVWKILIEKWKLCMPVCQIANKYSRSWLSERSGLYVQEKYIFWPHSRVSIS